LLSVKLIIHAYIVFSGRRGVVEEILDKDLSR
jgi:hypothetical protein